MKKLIFASFFALFAAFSQAQSLIPFTQSLRTQLEAKRIDLVKVQFFVKNPIVLKRSAVEQRAGTDQGKIVMNSSAVREIITFKSKNKLMPKPLMGICREKNSYTLGICFEDGDVRNKKLNFHQNDRTGEYMFHEPDGTTDYDGQSYEVAEGQNTILYVSKKEMSKLQTIKKNVGGIKVQ